MDFFCWDILSFKLSLFNFYQQHFLTTNYQNQVINIIKFVKQFLDSTTETQIQYWIKAHLQHGISEPLYYGDSVYKFKRLINLIESIPDLCLLSYSLCV